jgi:peroxiredoxin
VAKLAASTGHSPVVAYDPFVPLSPGDRAPTFILPDASTGEDVTNTWRDGPTVVAFFKVTCPVCQMAAPKVQALADGGARVVAIGEDPAPRLTAYARDYGQAVPTVSEPPPYRVSDAYDVVAVPTLFLVDEDGTVADAVSGWDRERWNQVAASVGVGPVSTPGDGLPPYRPG